MKIFNTVLVGQTSRQENAGAAPVPLAPHEHTNLSVLSRITVDAHGVLLFDGNPVDAVGQEFVNAAILEQFSVVDGKLLFAGNPVDTVGSVFDNDAVLRMFSQDAQGGLLFNGQPIEGGSGTSLPNADDLKRLAVDENGQLTVDGAVVSGSGGAITLTCTQAGTGIQVAKGFVGSDLGLRTLKAGANVTLNVTSDEIEINSSLSGEVSVASTFKQSDGYSTAPTVACGSTDTRLKYTEIATTVQSILCMRMESSITLDSVRASSVVESSAGVTLATDPAFRQGKCLAVSGGSSHVTLNATVNAALNSAIGGTGDFTIEFETAFTSQPFYNVLFGCYAGGGATVNDSFAVMAHGTGLYSYSVVGTTAQPSVNADGVGDGLVHHVAVVRSAGVLMLFVDGVKRSSTQFTGTLNKPTTSWRIGASATIGNNTFSGKLANIIVHKYARYTDSFTVPSYYEEAKSALNTISMEGKLFSASFWKYITSISVVSTETATAYLKWLMVDATGIWKWDTASSTWLAADPSNITTEGMTTTELTAALLNNQWNYRSDTVGFIAALVTTNGNSTPVLTSVTLRAVQSSDKTAGHTVMNELGSALPQRTQLQFKGMTVSDNGTTTVIQGHGEEVGVLQTQVATLQQQSGKVAGKEVVVESTDVGSTLVYDPASDTFKLAVRANGATGNGLYVTDNFVLAAGADAIVSHQNVVQGRAVYQVEEVTSAGNVADDRDVGYSSGLTSAAPIHGQAARAQRPGFRLPCQFTSIAKGVSKALPQGVIIPEVFQVDDTVYVQGGRVSSTAATKMIQTAEHDTPTVVSNSGAALAQAYTDSTSGHALIRNGEYVYRLGSTYYTGATSTVTKSLDRAHVDTPTAWESVGALDIVRVWTNRFILDGYLYEVGGAYDSGAASYSVSNKIVRSPLTDLTDTEEVGSFAGGYIYASAFYQYGDYLYIVGGRTGSAVTSTTTFSNKIYRAHVSDPLTWTQIGTFPIAIGYTGANVVGSKVIIGGIRTVDATYSVTTVYMSDAANPVSWSTLPAQSAALCMRGSIVVDDTVVFYGGATSSNVGSTSIESYNLTYTNTADRAVVYTADYSLDPVKSITAVELEARIPSGTDIRALVSFDHGVTWYYWTGSVWAPTTLDDAGFDLAPAVTASGTKFVVPGLSGETTTAFVRLAFQLKSTVSTLTPRLFGVSMKYEAAGTLSPMLVGGFSSVSADIGLKHKEGSYSVTNVRNLTSRELTLVLKVYDGAI